MSDNQFRNAQNIQDSSYITPQKRSDYFEQQHSKPNQQEQFHYANNNSIINQANLENTHIQGQKESISNINKIPTTFSFNQEGQFSIAKSIVENDSSFVNLHKSQIPQISQYQGDPQELVNMLTGRVYSLVEQVHKLSSIIDEMTAGQQALSEKYVELRSIYYQVLLDKNVQPKEQDQQWVILNPSPESKQRIQQSPYRSPRLQVENKVDSPQKQGDQVVQDQNSAFNQNQVQQKKDQLDENIQSQDEKVKRSLKANYQQQQLQNHTCQNCELRKQQEQLQRVEIQQLQSNLVIAKAEINRLNQHGPHQEQEKKIGFRQPIEIQENEIHKYNNMVQSSPKQNVLLNSPTNSSFNNSQRLKNNIDPNNVSLKDSIEVIKEYISDKAEEQTKRSKTPANANYSINSPTKLIRQSTPSSTKNSQSKNAFPSNVNTNTNNKNLNANFNNKNSNLNNHQNNLNNHPNNLNNNNPNQANNIANLFKSKNVQIDVRPK